MIDRQKLRMAQMVKLSVVVVLLLLANLEISWPQTQRSMAAPRATSNSLTDLPGEEAMPSPTPVGRPGVVTPAENKTALARPNFALASKGGKASASSSSPGYAPSGAIDGDELGLNFGKDGYWSSADASLPAWFQVDFSGTKTIGEIDVFSVQDNYTSPKEPDLRLTFTKYGLIDFKVQYWSSAGPVPPFKQVGFWLDVPVDGNPVTGNMNVWKKFTFPDLKTNKIRVLVSKTGDGYSRITEIEAWGNN